MEKRDFSKSGPRINRKANAGKNTSKPRQRFFNKNADKKTMHDRPFKDTTVKRLGFSPFQIRLIQIKLMPTGLPKLKSKLLSKDF